MFYCNKIGVRVSIVGLLVWLAFAHGMEARAAGLSFEHFTLKDGLSQSTVYCIMQDSRGFMWMGTRAGGLNKFDAYSFKTYKYDPDDSLSISGNQVLAICEDQRGDLWVGTRDDGLNRFDVKTEGFFHYFFDSADSTTISHKTINVIREDSDGNLWLGTNGGLCRYNRSEDNFIRYNQSKNLAAKDVRAIEFAENGMLWLGGKDGVFLYDPAKEVTEAVFTHDINNPNSISETHVQVLLKDRQGRLWAGTRNKGLNCLLDADKGIFRRYRHDPHNPQSISSDVVRTLHQDQQGNIWIGTKLALEQLLPGQQNVEQPAFIHYRHIKGEEHSILQNSVFSFCEDKSGNFWIGFYSEGISFLSSAQKKFEHFKNNFSDPSSLSSDMVSSFAVSESGIWVGTKGGGLDLFDRKTGKFVHHRADENKPGSLISNSVKALLVDRDGDLWVGTYQGLQLFDKKTRRFRLVLEGVDVYCLENGVDDEIWVGTRVNLIKLNKNTGRTETYQHRNSDPNSLSSGLINTLLLDSRKNLWVGTKNGLNWYDREKNHFVSYSHDKDDPSSLSNSYIISLSDDKNNALWIGTLDGLNKSTSVPGEFQRYGEKDGLPGNIISNVIVDKSGFLWVASSGRLSKINVAGNLSTANATTLFVQRTYDESDGLQDIEFMGNSACLTDRGEVFIGGVNGFNIFHPDSLSDNPLAPEVYITGFKIHNEPVIPGSPDSPLSTEISLASDIELSYKQTYISFEFVALNYTMPQKNQFAFRLEGFDKHWNYIGNKREAVYTNLPPGTYTFKVKASNNDGVWNEEGKSIQITIHPPWWEKAWFRAIVILILVLIIIGIYYLRLSRLKKQKQVLEQKVKERTHELKKAEEELQVKNGEIVRQNNDLISKTKELELSNATKDKFFSIIAHDIKGPLSSLLGLLDILNKNYPDFPDEERQEIIKLLFNSAQNIYDLSENLLVWSRSQRGQLSFTPKLHRVSKLLDSEVSLLKSMAAKKKIRIEMVQGNPEMQVFADKEMLRTIVRNLLSNAIKFTGENGAVKIEIEESKAGVGFKVSDSGIGIPEDMIGNLFKMSSSNSRPGTDNEKGTGLGLMLCYEFVKMHQGDIGVESREGQGTTFCFTIPHKAKIE